MGSTTEQGCSSLPTSHLQAVFLMVITLRTTGNYIHVLVLHAAIPGIAVYGLLVPQSQINVTRVTHSLGYRHNDCCSPGTAETGCPHQSIASAPTGVNLEVATAAPSIPLMYRVPAVPAAGGFWVMTAAPASGLRRESIRSTTVPAGQLR